jgi:hypothetical protein
MLMEGLSRKIGAALLALAVLFVTAPVVIASASTGSSPCDCPSAQSMQMKTHDMAPRNDPAKRHGSPCNDAQNCICGVSCGAAVNLAQTPSAPPSPSLPLQHVALSYFQVGHGISIKPTIPPPIASI